jgi:hypothetical protein
MTAKQHWLRAGPLMADGCQLPCRVRRGDTMNLNDLEVLQVDGRMRARGPVPGDPDLILTLNDVGPADLRLGRHRRSLTC